MVLTSFHQYVLSISSEHNWFNDVYNPSVACHVSTWFLGGLSLHLNHLIAERMSAPYWQFGTLPIGIFLSNLDSGQLETSLMTSYCHF